MMPDNCGMSTHSNFSITEPCNTFTYILYILTSYSHNNIIRLC